MQYIYDNRRLSKDEIMPYVDRFINFAKHHQNLTFLVDDLCDYPKLFSDAIDIENIKLPKSYWAELNVKN